MKSLLVVSLTVGWSALSATPLLAQPGGSRDAGANGWLFSLEAGKAQAQKSGKPLMVVVRCAP